ncbi:MAG: hypothetical protein V8R81_01750 [Clostridia bacterium]
MEDCLIIGIDISKGKDISCMTVARKSGRGMQVINQLFNEEAEDIYYKLINVQAKMEFPKIREEAIKRGMGKIQNIYSYKEILEVIEETIKLKQYTDKEREFILNHNTPRKLREILAAFWLTHTNDEFYHYFGFNWIPPMEIQEEARKAINKPLEQQINELANIPLLKATDFLNVIAPKEVIKDIEKNITMSYAIDSKTIYRRCY